MLSKKTIIIPLMASVMLIVSCNNKNYAFKLGRREYDHGTEKEYGEITCKQSKNKYIYVPFALEKCKAEKYLVTASDFTLKKSDTISFKCEKILDGFSYGPESGSKCDVEYDIYETDDYPASSTPLGAAFSTESVSEYKGCTLCYKGTALPLHENIGFEA